MNALLFTDPHLTDRAQDEYRWAIFDKLAAIAIEECVTHIFDLGDTWDRKDRHSGSLLNRTIKSFTWLAEETGASIYILEGNHDAPTVGQHYWEFLDRVGVHYITQPSLKAGIWLLPFSPNPVEDWKGIRFLDAHAIFMHQTVAGSMIEDGRRIEKAPHPMPLLPRGIPIYSGDVHRPQTIGGVTYIGVPHPTRFGESWPNRVFLIKNGEFGHPIEKTVTGMRKLILELNSFHELREVTVHPDDQVKIRYKLLASDMELWPSIEAEIRAWAKHKNVFISSLEANIIASDEPGAREQGLEALTTPEEVIRMFGAREQLSEDAVAVGLSVLQEAKTCGK
jgi:hypothetical protein